MIKSSSSLEKDTNEDISTSLTLNKSLLSCIHFYCVKLHKRIDYIKNPATYCDKDCYSENFESYSRSVISSRVTPRQAAGKHHPAMDSNIMNTSLYSNQESVNSVLSSIDSTISSIGSENQPKVSTSRSNKQKSQVNIITFRL